jgi:hypothetical protein
MEAEEAGTLPVETDKKDDTKNEDTKGSKDTSKKDDAKSTDDKGDKGDGDTAKGAGDADDGSAGADEDDGEFTADDAIETEEQVKEPTGPTDNAGIQLSPQESKFIADNIGEPLVIRGIRGTGDNAKEVEIKAYSPNDIPADFTFANDQQRTTAQTGFMRLEQKANELLGSYRQTQTQTQAQEFEQRENQGIKADVLELQTEGRFPKFKVRPGEPGFDNSPQAKQMAEVLQVMTERNELYLKQYEQGRPYKHIGFAEAFDLWEAKNPDRQAAKKADADQAKEDADRKQVAEQGTSNRGMSSNGVVKPTVRSGTTVSDILNRLDSEEW